MKFHIDQTKLAPICKKYNAEYLGVFGSIVHGDDNPDSDIDMLVRFAPEAETGLLELSAMRDDLQQITHRKVDLLTEGFLSKYFKNDVLRDVKPLYVKA
ncbi:MAG: nucleotidyltransferase family protein [Patescibacteria group bacterium]